MIGKIIGFCFGVAIAVFRLPTLTLLRQPENRAARIIRWACMMMLLAIRQPENSLAFTRFLAA